MASSGDVCKLAGVFEGAHFQFPIKDDFTSY
jgi:hypothetical protein